MSIPILTRTEQLAPDLLDTDAWQTIAGSSGRLERSVPPAPSPWAHSAFDRAVHIRPGSSDVEIQGELAEPIPVGEPFKLLLWVYLKNAPEVDPLRVRLPDLAGGGALVFSISASRFNPGWGLYRLNTFRAAGPITHVQIRRNADHDARVWLSNLVMVRRDEPTPVLSRMIQAQADAGRLI